MATANADRGEASLNLDGVDMVLRPAYEAIAAAELTLGRGLNDLARTAIAGSLTSSETAQIATEFIKAWGVETDNRDAAGANPKRIAKLIYCSPGGEHGAQKTIAGILAVAVTGGYDAEGNLKPATTTTTETKAPVAG